MLSKLVGCFKVQTKSVLQICFFVVFGLLHIGTFQNLRNECLTQREKSDPSDFFFVNSFFNYIVILPIITENLFSPYQSFNSDILLHSVLLIIVTYFFALPMQKRFLALEKRIAFLLFFFDSNYFSRAFLFHESARIFTNVLVSNMKINLCGFMFDNHSHHEIHCTLNP